MVVGSVNKKSVDWSTTCMCRNRSSGNKILRWMYGHTKIKKIRNEAIHDKGKCVLISEQDDEGDAAIALVYDKKMHRCIIEEVWEFGYSGYKES